MRRSTRKIKPKTFSEDFILGETPKRKEEIPKTEKNDTVSQPLADTATKKKTRYYNFMWGEMTLSERLEKEEEVIVDSIQGIEEGIKQFACLISKKSGRGNHISFQELKSCNTTFQANLSKLKKLKEEVHKFYGTRKNRREESTQTETRYSANEINKKLQDGVDDDELPRLLLGTWPSECLRSTDERKGNILKERDSDFVIVLDLAEDTNGLVMHKVKGIMPELDGLVKNGILEPGKIASVVQDRQLETAERKIFVIGVNSEQGDLNMVKNVIDGMAALKNVGSSGNVVYVASNGKIGHYLKKFLEYDSSREGLEKGALRTIYVDRRKVRKESEPDKVCSVNETRQKIRTVNVFAISDVNNVEYVELPEQKHMECPCCQDEIHVMCRENGAQDVSKKKIQSRDAEASEDINFKDPLILEDQDCVIDEVIQQVDVPEVPMEPDISTEELGEKLENGVDKEELPGLILKNWPTEIFRYTKERKGNVLVEKDVDLVLVLDLAARLEIRQKFKSSLPQVAYMIVTKMLRAGKIVSIKRPKVNCEIENGSIYLVTVDSKNGYLNAVKDLINGMASLKNIAPNCNLVYGSGTKRMGVLLMNLLEYTSRRELMDEELFKIVYLDVTIDMRDQVSGPIEEKIIEETTKDDQDQNLDKNQQRFLCEICGQVVGFYYSLVQHMKRHSDAKPYSCKVCKKQFKLSYTLSDHMRRHENKRPHTCEVCGVGYYRKHRLALHLRHHTGEKPYHCTVCGMRFYAKYGLRKHMEKYGEDHQPRVKKERKATDEQPGGKSYECDICKEKFSLYPVMRKHRREHVRSGVVLCPICGKQYSGYCSLRQHVALHTGEKPFSCDICSKRFAKKAYLESHMEIHATERSFSCEICGKRFKGKIALKCHKTKHHSRFKEELFKEADSKDNPLVCNLCGNEFAERDLLTKHMKDHPELTHDCNVCDERFPKHSALRNHLRRAHPKPSSHLCSICGKQFSSTNSLKLHVRLHTGERPYTCDICLKGFTMKTTLKLHMQTHDKNFSCDVCKKKFSRAFALKKHLKNNHLHSQKDGADTPFVCDICQKRFSKKNNLQVHIKTHGEKRFSCYICGKLFATSVTLRKHMQTQHLLKDEIIEVSGETIEVSTEPVEMNTETIHINGETIEVNTETIDIEVNNEDTETIEVNTEEGEAEVYVLLGDDIELNDELLQNFVIA